MRDTTPTTRLDNVEYETETAEYTVYVLVVRTMRCAVVRVRVVD